MRAVLPAAAVAAALALIPFSSARPAPASTVVATAQAQVNHVLVHDGRLYWTDAGRSGTAVRSVAVTGGPVTNLATEPVRDRRGFRLTYAQLQVVGARLFWSRQRTGFLDHWGIRSVPTGGGAMAVALNDDKGAEPLFLYGWRSAGPYLTAVLEAPAAFGLPDNTRIGALDPDTGEWTAVLQGRFDAKKVAIIAADGSTLYVRGVTSGGKSEIGRVDAAAGDSSYQALDTQPGTDTDLHEIGTIDGANLYYWSRRGAGEHGLYSLPLAGGKPERLLTGSFGPGLTADGGSLYWVRLGKLLRMPAAGGAPTTVTDGVAPLPADGGLAMDASAIYVVKRQSGSRFNIVRISR